MPRKPRILAVDDIAANLVAIEAVLDADFDLVFASSGREALDILERTPEVDVILMDIQMPLMDGYECAAHIKRMAACKDIPLIFITAIFNEDPHIKRGYQAGGMDYFTKPFDPELLRMKMSVYASFRQRAAVLREREKQIRETEQLLQAGRKLSAVLESLPVGILIADVDGRMCQANEEVSRIFEAKDALEHDAYGAMLGWWSRDGIALKGPEGPLARALASGQSSHNERVEIRCFDASAKTIVASVSPLRGAAGEVVGAVVVIKDITESKQIAVELEERVARLLSLGVELEQTADVAQSRPRETT